MTVRLGLLLSLLSVLAHSATLPTLSWQDAAALDSQEDMRLLGLLAGDAEDCTESVEGFKKAVKDMQGVVDVALVGLEGGDQISKAANKYGSELAGMKEGSCELQLVLLPFGKDKEDLDEYMVYEGPLEGKELQKFVTDFMPDHFTPEVMPATWEMFMTSGMQEMEAEDDDEDGEEKQAPTMPPKVLLITNKDHVPGVLKALALRFRIVAPALGFGWIRAHDEQNKVVLDQLGGDAGKVPRMIMLLPMPPSEESGGRPQISIQPYPGALKYTAMHGWLSQLAAMLGNIMGGNKPGSLEVPQLSSDAHLQEHCVAKGSGVCVVGLLDLERPGSQKLLKMMGKVAGKSQEQPFYFSYIDAPRHKSFLGPLSIGSGNLPTAVAISPARMRYAVLPGPLAEAADLSRFIDGVLSGRVKTLPLEVLPSLEHYGGGSSMGQEQDASGGDGGEGEAPVEEEFDLSDIMNEEVEPMEMSKEERMRQVEAELKAAQEAEEEAKKASSKKKKSKKKSKKSKSSSEEL